MDNCGTRNTNWPLLPKSIEGVFRSGAAHPPETNTQRMNDSMVSSLYTGFAVVESNENWKET